MKKITNKIYLIIAIGLAVFSTSCKEDDDVQDITPKNFPNSIAINEAGFYPEGIVYEESEDVFYSGSVNKGKIIKVDLEGNEEVFAEDSTLVSVLGMTIDMTNNRLIVCNTDPGVGTKTSSSTVGQLAQIVVYNLSDGEKIRTVDLGGLSEGGHLANDLTVDNDGNIYITDSFSPTIYMVDVMGNASVLVSDPLFSAPAGAFGLNGIAYHPDHYLIVGKYDEGKLYRVSLNSGNQITEITLDGAVNTVDGILITGNNTIVLASNNITGDDFLEAIYEIETIDNWATGTISNTFTTSQGSFPTTLDIVEGNIYVINASLTSLFGGVTPPVDEFLIEKMPF